MTTRIAVVEDHELFRSVLRATIESDNRYQLAFETDDGGDALEQLTRFDVDLALIDVSLPTINGIDVAATIRRRWPEISCVVVSGDSNPTYVRSALDAGAKAVVLKGPLTELIDGIEAARRGDTYVSPGLRTGAQDEHGS